MAVTCANRSKTQVDDQAELECLVERLTARVEYLEKEVAELNEWLTEVADDTLDREGV